jgi:hypothetical protein
MSKDDIWRRFERTNTDTTGVCILVCIVLVSIRVLCGWVLLLEDGHGARNVGTSEPACTYTQLRRNSYFRYPDVSQGTVLGFHWARRLWRRVKPHLLVVVTVLHKSQLDATRTPLIFADKFRDYSSVGKWHCCSEAKSTRSTVVGSAVYARRQKMVCTIARSTRKKSRSQCA